MSTKDWFELEIVRPSKTELMEVEWIDVQSPNGNFVVSVDHGPIVSILKNRGKLTYKRVGGEECSIDVYGGIFYLSGVKSTIILDL